MTRPQGEVYDIGYQRYEGLREGRNRARTAVWSNGVRTALGFGRGWPSMVVPLLSMVILMGIALIFVILGAVLDPLIDDFPTHSEFYKGSALVFIAFAAIVAPELLCSDRRNGVISLYLVRPLSSTDYVVGRWLAFFSVALVFVYLPQITLFIGLTLGAEDSVQHLKDKWDMVPRFIAAGFAIAIFNTTISLAAAAFTTRRAFAAAFVVGVWFVAWATSEILVEEIGGANAKWFAMINVGHIPIFLNDIIFDKVGGEGSYVAIRQHSNIIVIGWFMVLTLVPAALLWWKYRNLKI